MNVTVLLSKVLGSSISSVRSKSHTGTPMSASVIFTIPSHPLPTPGICSDGLYLARLHVHTHMYVHTHTHTYAHAHMHACTKEVVTIAAETETVQVNDARVFQPKEHRVCQTLLAVRHTRMTRATMFLVT